MVLRNVLYHVVFTRNVVTVANLRDVDGVPLEDLMASVCVWLEHGVGHVGNVSWEMCPMKMDLLQVT